MQNMPHMFRMYPPKEIAGYFPQFMFPLHALENLIFNGFVFFLLSSSDIEQNIIDKYLKQLY